MSERALSITNTQETIDWYSLASDEKLVSAIAGYFGWPVKAVNIHPGEKLLLVNTGKRWVSTPHLSYGGTNSGIDYYANPLLQDKKWIIRDIKPVSDHYLYDKVISYLPLESTAKDQMSALPGGVRRKIRKAEKNGVIVRQGNTELLEDFYQVLVRSLHRLGAPCLSKSFFHHMLHTTPATIFVAYFGDKPIGCSFMIGSKGFYENLWFGSLTRYHHLYTTYLLHWTMMQQAIHENGKVYSMGRSTRDGSVYFYKKQYGTLDQPIYRSYSHPAKVNLRNATILANIWKHLPLLVVKTLGPAFAKWFY